MNHLSYGLLSLLSQSPLSGYDIMLRIQPFWPAKHSQIYPLLAQLEKRGKVRHELVAQSDKPDKKVYSLTDKGIDTLRQWLSEPASDPVTRDDLYLKALCLSLVGPQQAEQLFAARLDFYQMKRERYDGKLRQLLQAGGWSPDEVPPYDHQLFGAWLMIQKAIRINDTNIAWCEWALGLVGASAKSGGRSE